MKNAKKLFLFALAVMLLAVVLCFNAGAVSYEGTFGANGNNLTWKVDADTATLYIDGYGDMEDFADERSTPWYEYLEAGFAYVSIGDGVTSIGDFAFSSLKADTITIPDNLEDNVIQLHEKLFGTANYQPTDDVIEYSEYLKD